MSDLDGWNGAARHDDSQNDGMQALVNRLRSLLARLEGVERGGPLRAAGITVEDTGLIIDSSATVLGSLYINRGGVLDTPGVLYAYLGESGRTAMRLQPPRLDPDDDTVLYLEGPTPGAQGMALLRSGGTTTVAADGVVFIRGSGLDVETTGSTTIEATDGVVFIRGTDLDVETDSGGIYLDATGYARLAGDGFTLGTTSESHRVYTAGDDLVINAPTRTFFAFGSPGGIYIAGTMTASGTKSFRIPHPTKPDLDLVHAAVEAPVAGLHYGPYRTQLDDDGSAVVDLPEYFEALTAPDERDAIVQAIGRPFPTGADDVVNGQVRVYGDPGRTVSVHVWARRGDDDGQFDLEPPRMDTPTGGDAPDRGHQGES